MPHVASVLPSFLFIVPSLVGSINAGVDVRCGWIGASATAERSRLTAEVFRLYRCYPLLTTFNSTRHDIASDDPSSLEADYCLIPCLLFELQTLARSGQAIHDAVPESTSIIRLLAEITSKWREGSSIISKFVWYLVLH